MHRILRLLLIAALFALPLAMAGCPAEEETGGAPVRRSTSPTPDPNLGGKIGWHVVAPAVA